ncbi:MAG TPA: hypothetical protein VJ528_12010 [Geothrix sp.]|nr:hypothetical protein [Geothrix sp.]
MKETLPQGLESADVRTDIAVQAAALPAASPEDGADPDQYLWGV